MAGIEKHLERLTELNWEVVKEVELMEDHGDQDFVLNIAIRNLRTAFTTTVEHLKSKTTTKS